MSKTQIRRMMGGGVVAVALGYWGWLNRRLFCVNDITTGESSAYPELRSRVYYADVTQAMTAGEQALRRLPRWRQMSRDTENDALEAEVRTPLGLFTEDVTAYFFPLGHGQTHVTIRSRSRRGGGDFGRNAAHIRDLQSAMDDWLNMDAAF